MKKASYMQSSAQNKKLIIIGIVLAAAVLISAAVLLWLNLASHDNTSKEAFKATSFQVYKDVRSLYFERSDGNRLELSDYKGKTVVLVYWASWCPHCKEVLPTIDSLAAKVTSQADTVFLLVNKTDGTKETKDSALKYLSDNNIKTESVFDKGLIAYNELGLKKIPSTLVIDPQGRLITVSNASVPEISKLLAMIKNAKEGNETALLSFIQNSMTDKQGGIRTTYLDGDGSLPSGSDVLSESQGLIMLYAVSADNKTLFDSVYLYVGKHLTAANLAAWVTRADNTYTVNAVLDDFRIYRALYAANNKWGGYDEQIKSLSDALYNYCTNGGELVDFYDSGVSAKASRLTLCYADFEALSLLAKSDSRWKEVYDKSLSVVKNGVISEKFQLYRSYYDYSESRYPSSKINMSEELTTWLNLSKAGLLPQEALDWLKDRLSEGVLYSVYDEDGKPDDESRTESTAVYALCAMIAVSEKEPEMARQAIGMMDKMRILDVSSSYNGAFGNSDGSGIYSFDQLMALLAYQTMEAAGG